MRALACTLALLSIACAAESDRAEEFAGLCSETFECLVDGCSAELSDYEAALSEDDDACYAECDLQTPDGSPEFDACVAECDAPLLAAVDALSTCEAPCSGGYFTSGLMAEANDCEVYFGGGLSLTAKGAWPVCGHALGWLAFREHVEGFCVASNFEAP